VDEAIVTDGAPDGVAEFALRVTVVEAVRVFALAFT